MPPCCPRPNHEPAACCHQVTIYSSCGMKYRKHVGGPTSGVALRADPVFGEDRRPAFDNVAVGCGSVGCGASECVLRCRPGISRPELSRALCRTLRHICSIRCSPHRCHAPPRSAANGETWFGQLVCFLETRPERGEGAAQRRAYVRWYSEAPHSELTSHLPFSRLKWSTHERPDGRGPSLPGQPWYQLIELEHIIEPVFLQPDPTQHGYFFYNHYVR